MRAVDEREKQAGAPLGRAERSEAHPKWSPSLRSEGGRERFRRMLDADAIDLIIRRYRGRELPDE